MDSSCPYCGGKGGHEYRGERGYSVWKPCSYCDRQDRQRRKLKFAELPKKYQEVQLKDFRTEYYRTQAGRAIISSTCKIIKYYLEHFAEMQESGKGLYLYSETKGSGKTYMIAGIASKLLENHNLKFATSLRILEEIRATWNSNRNEKYSESRLIQELIDVEILLIDDFGTEKIADWINDKFYYILNERYNNRRVTMYTSNKTLETLPYDGRIISRVRQSTYQIGFPEESVRDYIAEQDNRELLKKIGN